MVDIASPAALKRLIRSSEELAIIDVRDEGAFVRSHLFYACNVPLARLASGARRLMPRRQVRVILVDSRGEPGSDAYEAASILRKLGYTRAGILGGGMASWDSEGLELFSGFHVPSKAFGEFIEHAHGTPHLTAQEVKAMMDRRANMVVVDSRSFEEYQRMCIPGAISLPGAELVWRIGEVAPDPTTLVVVNCAGRTRSIIGTQSLVNAHVPNPVAALKDGTSGWQLAGLELEHGQFRTVPSPSGAAANDARRRASGVAGQHDVRHIDRITLRDWQADADRTLYVFDVRPPEEYAAGHLPGSLNAPGGQLVQATDSYVGVLGARVVLVDPEGVRADITASWLAQMGCCEVAVLDATAADLSERSAQALHPAAIEGIGVQGLHAMMHSSLAFMVIDLADARAYAEGHLPGAVRAEAREIAAHSRRLANLDALVIASANEAETQRAIHDLLLHVTPSTMRTYTKGLAPWKSAGFAVERGEGRDLQLAEPARRVEIEAELRKYLRWETGLIAQMKRDGDAFFMPSRRGPR